MSEGKVSERVRQTCDRMTERALNDGVTIRHPHPTGRCNWCNEIQAAIDAETESLREAVLGDVAADRAVHIERALTAEAKLAHARREALLEAAEQFPKRFRDFAVFSDVVAWLRALAEEQR